MHTPADPTYIKNLVRRSLDASSNKEELTSEISGLSPEDTQVYTIQLLEHMTYLKKYQSRIIAGHKPGQIYYNEKFALATRDVLDSLISNPQKDILIDSMVIGCTVETLLARVQQSWSYLIDFLDPNKRYVELRGQVKCLREADRYVRFSWKFIKPDLDGPCKFITTEVPRLIDRKYEELVVEGRKAKLNLPWQERVNNFISESNKGEILSIDGLRLEEDEMQGVKNLVDQVSHTFILARLNRTMIKILNNPEAAAQIREEELKQAARLEKLISDKEETNTTGDLPDDYV